ncbi:DUF975 family protein [Convivina praedatoris]|uniref:DUF975 family protein n=1 Tax=Convivina praedatoris TaxID=2880963 RepID=A0ABM9D028_9LACO|nr:DUF975 family protein [Convivina sp. LMG 32447]CAH1850324.1 hypothetical protein R078138_00112 [Convivina sp. LMG 32447]CAH1850865.1 hypothetical protein LMG032447_00220 [Convivina sp. LMG 32447]CAH1850879.1 hypothetical protein R077815_00218 [Convivina sp. LMG 32447]
MNRSELKHSVKERLSGNYGYVILVTLPALIVSFLSGGWSGSHSANYDSITNNTATVVDYVNMFHLDFTSDLFSIVGFFVEIGVALALLDFYRNQEKKPHPFLQFIYVYQQKGLFLGSLVIGILQYVWILLWTLLLIVPGIIKSLAYSQAGFIYRDALDKGEKLGYTEAITQSRKLMDGHKAEYFVLQLSFIGWFLLIGVTFGIAAIWVVPYYQMTMSAYYDQLSGSSDDGLIIDSAAS